MGDYHYYIYDTYFGDINEKLFPGKANVAATVVPTASLHEHTEWKYTTSGHNNIKHNDVY